jgi:hypothetical protein
MIGFEVSDIAIVAACALIAVAIICRTVTHLSRKDDRQTFWSEWDD